MDNLLSERLILASSSPRRKMLLAEAGYDFVVIEPSPGAECGVCSGESPPELVARLAWQKAKDVAQHQADGLILGADTVAACCGQILGKPKDRQHAHEMLSLMRGRKHDVYSGICLWQRPDDQVAVHVDRTTLVMDAFSDAELEAYLDTDQWEGKAGAFGFQDGLDWVKIVEGSESNVVGLPMEKLAWALRQRSLERGTDAPSSQETE